MSDYSILVFRATVLNTSGDNISMVIKKDHFMVIVISHKGGVMRHRLNTLIPTDHEGH